MSFRHFAAGGEFQSKDRGYLLDLYMQEIDAWEEGKPSVPGHHGGITEQDPNSAFARYMRKKQEEMDAASKIER